MTDRYDFLRKIPLFINLPDPDLEQICQAIEEIHLSAGEELFAEGSIGQQAFVIKEGQIEIYRTANDKKVQLAIRNPGEVIGEISLLENNPRIASGRALTDSLLLAISSSQFNHLLDTSPSAARTVLQNVTNRLQSTESLLLQNEKMAQLGTFTAGIAHEFNNPAAAVQRGAEQMKVAFEEFLAASARLDSAGLTSDQRQSLQALQEQIRLRAFDPIALDPVSRSDMETELEAWLEEQDIDAGWELAPQMVCLGYRVQDFERLKSVYSSSGVEAVMQWAAKSFSIYELLNEISQGASRISDIVKALKTYVYLDQGPLQEVNLHEGLENTLVIMGFKLRSGVEVLRDYDPTIPTVLAYGSELNQVWTNLIDNAIDAMNGKGKITIKTSYQAPWAIVDIIDTGPGISPEILPRLFTPFFTTKPVGKGTGLGLNISYKIILKHRGDIKVRSRPGETHFEVWLPVDPQADQGSKPAIPIQQPGASKT